MKDERERLGHMLEAIAKLDKYAALGAIRFTLEFGTGRTTPRPSRRSLLRSAA